MKRLCKKKLHEYEVGSGCYECKKASSVEWKRKKRAEDGVERPTDKKKLRVMTRVSDLSQSVSLNGKVAWQMKDGKSEFAAWVMDEWGFEGMKAVVKAIEGIYG